MKIDRNRPDYDINADYYGWRNATVNRYSVHPSVEFAQRAMIAHENVKSCAVPMIEPLHE